MSSVQPSTSSFEFTKEKTNFVRLCMLLVDVCACVLRDVLRQHIPENKLSKQIRKKKKMIKLNYSQQNLVSSGTYSEFDVSLLYNILRNICGGWLSHRRGWGNCPDPSDRCIAANIERINLFRNEHVVHIASASVDDVTFTRLWVDVRQAVEELDQILTVGNKSIATSYKHMVDKLEVVRLDGEQERRYIALAKEQSKLSTEVEEMKGKLKRKADITEVEEANKRIRVIEDRDKAKEASPVCTVKQNIHDNTEATIKHHSENKCYTGTTMVQTILDKLSTDHVVVLSGKAGTGKTTIALEVMRKLADSSLPDPREPAIINDAAHWDNVVNSNKKMVVFLDDPIGKTNFDEVNCEKWEKYFSNLMACAKRGNVYVIVGIRSSILKESKLRYTLDKYELFGSRYSLDLSREEYGLSLSEKTEMLKCYSACHNRPLTESDKNTIINTDTYYGFPFTCYLFFGDDARFKLGAEFFKHSKPLYREIENLRSSAKRKKSQYCALVYVLIKHKIDTSAIDMKLVREIACEIAGLENMKIVDIEDAVEDIDGTYLTSIDSSGNVYSFLHETVLEAICVSFGRIAPEIVIHKCTETVFRELLKPSYYRSKPEEVVLKMRPSDYPVLVDRLLATDTLDHGLERTTLLRLVDEICVDPFFDQIKNGSCGDREALKTLADISEHKSDVFCYFIACRFGRSELVKEILERTCTADGHKALPRNAIVHGLFQAAQHGHLFTVKVLAEYDVTLVDCGYYWKQPYISSIHIAVTNNDIPLVKYLLTFNPDLRKTYDFVDTKTMLHECTDKNCKEALEVILKFDPTLANLEDRIGVPILYYSAQLMKNADIVRILYDYKANVKHVDAYDKNFLQYCVDNDWPDMFETVLRDNPDMAKTSDNASECLVRYADNMKRTSIIKILCKYDHNQARLDQLNRMKLFKLCVEKNNYDELEELIKRNPAAINMSGDLLVCYAALLGNKRMVSFLLSHHADSAGYDVYGYSLLHYCIAQGWDDVVNELLENNTDIIVPTLQNSLSCMHIAAFFGRVSLLETFEELGQRLTDVTSNGCSVLLCAMLAMRYGPGGTLKFENKTYLDVTLHHKIKISTTLGSEGEYYQLFERIFTENKQAVDETAVALDSYDNNLLHYLVLNEAMTLIDLLLTHKRDILFDENPVHAKIHSIIQLTALLGRKHLFLKFWEAGVRPHDGESSLKDVAQSSLYRSDIVLDPTELVVGVNASGTTFGRKKDYVDIIEFLEKNCTQ